MKKPNDEEVYLVFTVGEDGINIIGNSSGLKSFASLLVEMSESEFGDHAHLSVSMHEHKRSKRIIVDFEKVNDELKGKLTIDSDVSIFKSRRPKNI